jgi:hypothetical protein
MVAAIRTYVVLQIMAVLYLALRWGRFMLALLWRFFNSADD